MSKRDKPWQGCNSRKVHASLGRRFCSWSERAWWTLTGRRGVNSLLGYWQQSCRKIKQYNHLNVLLVAEIESVTQGCVSAESFPLPYFPLSVPVRAAGTLWSECYLHCCGLIRVFASSLSWITALKSKHCRSRPGKDRNMQEHTSRNAPSYRKPFSSYTDMEYAPILEKLITIYSHFHWQ